MYTGSICAGMLAAWATPAKIQKSSRPAFFPALFHCFVFRLPSFQELDGELSHTYL
jgi:hypothetical protein